ncbi:MAG TPA: alpha/beta fold hydrolase [Polyangiaceae bacterium]|nr:alpha/beta fold hydrolase [Polyangiaceae bacterium]
MPAHFVLVPGAGGMASYWYRVVPLLEQAGHRATAVDLPGDDERAGLSVYADRVIEAIGAGKEAILVAQSLGGFTAPLVCARQSIGMLVFVNAMIPVPGETAGAWWDDTGATPARIAAAERGGYEKEFDVDTYFLHDVPADVAAQGEDEQRSEAQIVFSEPCRFAAWPEVPTHVIAGQGDRFFPLEFQRRVARKRLGMDVDEVPGGHLVALSNPRGLVDQLLRYL